MYITTVCTTKSVIFGFTCRHFFFSACSRFICLSTACIAEKAAREAKFDSFGGPDSMFILLAVLYCMCSIRGSEIKITNRFYMYLCSNFKATQQTNFCGYTFGIWITQKFLHHMKAHTKSTTVLCGDFNESFVIMRVDNFPFMTLISIVLIIENI